MAITRHPEALEEGGPAPWVGRRMTLDEFLALPDVTPHLEYDDGVVTQKVAPKPVQGSLQLFLGKMMDTIARDARLGVVLTETRFALPGWAPVPDLVFYRRERLRVRRAPADFTEPPDLAIEIASPEQKRTDLMLKCLRFIARGTAVAVLVDPDEEAVLIFRPDRPLVVLRGDDRIDLDDVLPGFELTVRGLFEAVNWEWLDEAPGSAEGGGSPPEPAEGSAAEGSAAEGGAPA